MPTFVFAGGTPPGYRHPLAFFHRVAAATGGVVQVGPTHRTTVSAKSIRISPNRNLLDEPFINALDEFGASYVLHYSLSGVPRAGWSEREDQTAGRRRVSRADKEWVHRR